MAEKPSVQRLPGAGAHVPALDGIRGLAIIFVLFHHFALYGGMRPRVLVDEVFYRTALGGWFGVDLFFVLSGFLITGILYETKQDPNYFRNFYMRRVLRIFPLYYGSLVLFFFVVPWLIPMSQGFASMRSEQIWYWTYLVNVKIAIDGWPQFNDLAHFWSLAIEEQFYLFWPLVVFGFGRKNLIRICLFCIGVAFATRLVLFFVGSELAGYVLTPSRLDALAVGALIAVSARGPRGVAGLAGWVKPALIGGSVLLVLIVVWNGRLIATDAVVRTAGFTIIAALFGGLLLLALLVPRESRLGRIFAHPVLVFFGKYSYAIYVFHHPVVLGLRRSGFTARSFPRLWGSELPGELVFIVVAGSVSIALALVSWYAWESQFLKLKRRFAYGSRARQPSMPLPRPEPTAERTG